MGSRRSKGILSIAKETLTMETIQRNRSSKEEALISSKLMTVMMKVMVKRMPMPVWVMDTIDG